MVPLTKALAKNQWEKDAGEEGAVWKKTESNFLINPDECIMGLQELGENEAGVGGGRGLLEEEGVHCLPWWLPDDAEGGWTSWVSLGRLLGSRPCGSATVLAVLSRLHQLWGSSYTSDFFPATHPRGQWDENCGSWWHSPVIHGTALEEKNSLCKFGNPSLNPPFHEAKE